MVMVGLNIIMIFKNIIWLMIDLFSVKLILYLYITVYYTNKVNTTHYSYLIALSHIRLMPSDASPNWNTNMLWHYDINFLKIFYLLFILFDQKIKYQLFVWYLDLMRNFFSLIKLNFRLTLIIFVLILLIMIHHSSKYTQFDDSMLMHHKNLFVLKNKLLTKIMKVELI